ARSDRFLRPVCRAVAQYGHADGLQARHFHGRAGPCRPLPARKSRKLSKPISPAACLLVGVAFGASPAQPESLDELAALAHTAGFSPRDSVAVRRARPDPALFIGSGKADEIGAQLAAEGIALVVFDQELSAIQQRNLQRRWNVSVIDRTELILEIFAQRAQSHEGKLQVELARLEHLSARLVRGWSHLERQRGGIGVRGGPGETQLELDRRMLSVRVKRLRAQLEQLRKQRRTRRRARDRKPAF